MKDLAGILKLVKGEVKDAALSVGSDPQYRPRRLPFGIEPLDSILGGGLPFGRVTLVKGDFSSGKTFLAQKALEAAQKAELACAYIDVERSLDPDWFRTTGVDLGRVIVAQPSSGEEALDIAIALVRAETDLVVLDSIAALVPTAEVEEGMGQQYVGALARLLNKGLRKLTVENKNRSILLFLNQLRTGIGPAPFPTEALPGGKGQWAFSSIVLDIRRGPWIEERDGLEKKRIGFNIRIRTEKNKLAPPLQVCELPFIFEGGVIDTTRGLLELALDLGVVQKQGALYESDLFEGKVRGKLNVLALLKGNAELMAALRGRIRGAKRDSRAPQTAGDSE